MIGKKKSQGKIHELNKAIDEIKKLKRQYDDLDPKTKKKIHAGLAGVAAFILGANAMRRHNKKKAAKKAEKNK